jgi:hypothetical protein
MPNSEPPDPRNPESESEATVRLPAGEPANPYSTQRLDLSKHLDAGSTLKLPLERSEPGADETQRLVLPRVDEPPVRVEKVDQPAETAGQTLKLPARPKVPKPTSRWMVPLVLGLLVVLGGGAYLAFSRSTASPPVPPPVLAPTTEAVPPAAQATFEQAKAGDVRSMHLLGLMYYNGLNLPRDREKGLYWLRKAAEKGSNAARAELGQIEGGR